jgi:hypothetical protein
MGYNNGLHLSANNNDDDDDDNNISYRVETDDK